MAISKRKRNSLAKKMQALGLKEKDLEEKFIKGSGAGGQKVNKTSSCVYLKYIPLQIEVKCQKSRSLQENRFFARRIIVAKIEQKREKKEKAKKEKIAKIKKQKKKRSRRAKKKLREFKEKRSSKKEFRSKEIELD